MGGVEIRYRKKGVLLNLAFLAQPLDKFTHKSGLGSMCFLVLTLDQRHEPGTAEQTGVLGIAHPDI